MQSIQRLLMEKCVHPVQIYQFEKMEKKKLDARSLSSFSGTKSRTQGLYFPLVFFPSVFQMQFSRFINFFSVASIFSVSHATRGLTFHLLRIGLTRKEMSMKSHE